MGDDEQLLQVATTASIACGFHAGDPVIMARTVALARRHGVAVGAHPGHLDLYGFGRRRITGEPPEGLATMIVYRPGALLTDTGEVVERALRIVEEGAVVSASGRVLPLPCDSLCVHGDTPGALAMARALRAALEAAGVTVAAFTAS